MAGPGASSSLAGGTVAPPAVPWPRGEEEDEEAAAVRPGAETHQEDTATPAAEPTPLAKAAEVTAAVLRDKERVVAELEKTLEHHKEQLAAAREQKKAKEEADAKARREAKEAKERVAAQKKREEANKAAQARNVFGEVLAPCVFGAPGPGDSCLLDAGGGGSAERHASFCVQPPAANRDPFCVSAAQFGRYLALVPTDSAPGSLRAKCGAVPEEALHSSLAETEFVTSEGYLSVADHLCRFCPMEGLLAAGPGEACKEVLSGRFTTRTTTTHTTTQATTSLAESSGGDGGGGWWSSPASPSKPSFSFGQPKGGKFQDHPDVFWVFASVGAFGWIICICVVLRREPDPWLSSSDSEDFSARRRTPRELKASRKPKALFAGAWEMLGQTQFVTEDQIRWQDRKVTDIRAISTKAFQITTNGRVERAELDPDGQRLIWSNGAVWLRVEEGTPLLS